MSETIIAEGSPVRWRHGFGHRKGIVQSYVETHDAYLIEQGGSVHRVPADRVTALAKPRRMVGRVTRRGTAERPQGVVSQPKPPKRWESAAFLRHVRARPCAWCGVAGPSEAHHWQPDPSGMGRKPDDTRCVPLCTRCHRAFHDTGTLPRATRTETERVFLDAQVRCLSAWVRGEVSE